MKALECVRIIMERKGLRTVDMCNRLNINSSLFCTRLNMKNVSVTKLDEMLRVMDYKIVVVPSDAKLPKEALRIE